jgi:hypothetical protein
LTPTSRENWARFCRRPSRTPDRASTAVIDQ